MAENENIITLVGRIGQEPELRATSKGDVLNFTVAMNERKRNADDSWADGPTSWFRVSAWNDLARHGHASLHRGQQVIVRGVLTIREFQVEGGGKSKNAEVRATSLGHDLRWGTTVYTDGARPAARPSALPSAEHESVAQRESVPQRETVPQQEPAPQRETVGAAASGGWGAPYEEETPF